MKFLIIAPRFHTNLYYRAKALQDAGHHVKVVVLYQGKSEYYQNIETQVLKLSFFSRFISKILRRLKKNHLKTGFELRIETPDKELNKIFKAYRPDIVLLKAYQNLLAVKSLIIAKKYKAKVLMLTQTPYNHIKGSKFLFKLNILIFKYLKVCAYLTPIKINYDIFKEAGIENIYYLPFVYPVKDMEIKKPEDEIKILSVGKFQKRKEQLLLLKTVHRLIKEGFDIKLCFIGEAVNLKYIKTLYNYINKEGISDKVCIETNMPYKIISKEYKNYDLFVLPAYNEPAAYSPVEALANGLPVICSDQNGTKCYIKEGQNGSIFKAKNEDDLYKNIKGCISDKEKLYRLKQNALHSAKENHHPDNYSVQILKICKDAK